MDSDSAIFDSWQYHLTRSCSVEGSTKHACETSRAGTTGCFSACQMKKKLARIRDRSLDFMNELEIIYNPNVFSLLYLFSSLPSQILAKVPHPHICLVLLRKIEFFIATVACRGQALRLCNRPRDNFDSNRHYIKMN